MHRLIQILFKPGQEWTRIKEESFSFSRFFVSYPLILAAVSPVIRFLTGFVHGHYKQPFTGWSWAVVRRELLFCAAIYLCSLAAVYIWGRIISLLAPLFSSRRKKTESLVLAVFSMIPFWLGGAFYLIPEYGWIVKIGVGFYGVYILFRGLKSDILETPRKKVFGYLLLSCVFGLGLVVLAEMLPRFIFTAWGVIQIG